MPKAKTYTKKEYEKLGKMLHTIAEIGVSDQKKLYKVAFIKGIVSGLGGVIGATIVVAFLLWIFVLIENVPFIGPVIDLVRTKIE